MKVVHINETDVIGGAARAAYRIHAALVMAGVDSRMRVLRRATDDPRVQSGTPARVNRHWFKTKDWLVGKLHQILRIRGEQYQSLAWPSSGLGKELQTAGDDIVHLHWLGRFTLSINEIGRLEKPRVWTLHDQWAFCGTEHYSVQYGMSEERFVNGYTKAGAPVPNRFFDVDRHTWKRKRHHWKTPISIVCPSNWMKADAKRSALMGDWPITVIPYPIDVSTWIPRGKEESRSLLGLPKDTPLILFCATGGFADPRKGGDLLNEALKTLISRWPGKSSKPELVVVGQSFPRPNDLPAVPTHYLGKLSDEVSLRLAYCSADVVAIPSRQDNLPNVGIEAQACGCPVVSFKLGGLPDIVEDKVTGAMAEPLDTESLAEAIMWTLIVPQRREMLSRAARKRAETLWSPSVVAAQYLKVYQSAGEGV